MPEYASTETEARISFCAAKMGEMIEEWDKEKKTGKENLSEQQKEGLEKLTDRRKKKEIVCFPTDKSGVMTVDSPENYVLSMQAHIQDTARATQDDYETAEKLINSHMQCWCNILKFDL